MSSRNLPSAAYLRQCFRYDNGHLFWLPRPREHFKTQRAFRMWNGKFANKEAGAIIHARGGDRWMISIDSSPFYRHKIIWAFHHDEWPPEIDHKNRITTDDRIDNLRPCTHSENGSNRKAGKNNTSGYKGVSYQKKTGKFMARIGIGNQRLFLGLFDTPEQAHNAYVEASKEHFGEFAEQSHEGNAMGTSGQ
jgi:hypothetical protein